MITFVEWLGGADVRLFFLDGTVVERALPGVKNARRVRIVDQGLGVDPGDGLGEMGAWLLYRQRGGKRYRYSGENVRHRRQPLISMVEWVYGKVVRIFWSTGRIAELVMPVRSARGAKIVSHGLGLDPGNGKDLCAVALHERTDGKVWKMGHWT